MQSVLHSGNYASYYEKYSTLQSVLPIPHFDSNAPSAYTNVRVPFKALVTVPPGQYALMSPNPSSSVFDTITGNATDINFFGQLYNTAVATPGKAITYINKPFDVSTANRGFTSATILQHTPTFPKGDYRGEASYNSGFATQTYGGAWEVDVDVPERGSGNITIVRSTEFQGRGMQSTLAEDPPTLFVSEEDGAVPILYRLVQGRAWFPTDQHPNHTIPYKWVGTDAYFTPAQDGMSGVGAPRWVTSPLSMNLGGALIDQYDIGDTSFLLPGRKNVHRGRIHADRQQGFIRRQQVDSVSEVGTVTAANPSPAVSDIAAVSGYYFYTGFDAAESPGGPDLPIVGKGQVPSNNPFTGPALGQDAIRVTNTSTTESLTVSVVGWMTCACVADPYSAYPTALAQLHTEKFTVPTGAHQNVTCLKEQCSSASLSVKPDVPPPGTEHQPSIFQKVGNTILDLARSDVGRRATEVGTHLLANGLRANSYDPSSRRRIM